MFNKFYISFVLATASVLGFAQAQNDPRDAVIEKLSKKTEQLSAELKNLQQEMRQFKKQKQARVSHQITTPAPVVAPEMIAPTTATNGETRWMHGAPIITTAPYFGVRSQFDSSHLLVLIPSMHEDLRLLRFRENIYNEKIKNHIPTNIHESLIKISGKLEAQASRRRNYNGKKTSDLDLSDGEIDFLVTPSSKISGLFALSYDNGTGLTYTTRTTHSRIFLDKGFVTFGELSQTPFYMTIGQFYMPFGRYASGMISAPITQPMGRVKARALQFGVAPTGSGFNSEIFIYRGNTLVNTQSNNVREGGFNVDYECPAKHRVGVSWISNLAEAQGMQNTGGTAFSGFAANNNLTNRTPAYNLHGSLNFGAFNINAEYLSTTTAFHAADLTFNGVAAKPSALNVEAGYSFNAFNRPSNINVGYGQTKQALGLNLPSNRYIVAFNTSFSRDTIESIEFAHETNYRLSDSATGAGGAAFGPTGRSQNRVVAQVGMYF